MARGDYDVERNERESGFGPGRVLYIAPGLITGGQQINIDESVTDVSPNTIIEAAKNPSWWLVVISLVTVFLLFKRNVGTN